MPSMFHSVSSAAGLTKVRLSYLNAAGAVSVAVAAAADEVAALLVADVGARRRVSCGSTIRSAPSRGRSE